MAPNGILITGLTQAWKSPRVSFCCSSSFGWSAEGSNCFPSPALTGNDWPNVAHPSMTQLAGTSNRKPHLLHLFGHALPCSFEVGRRRQGRKEEETGISRNKPKNQNKLNAPHRHECAMQWSLALLLSRGLALRRRSKMDRGHALRMLGAALHGTR